MPIIFVGNIIGDAGLLAINIAYPIIALIQSVKTCIGMSGTVYYSINGAEGNREKQINSSLLLGGFF